MDTSPNTWTLGVLIMMCKWDDYSYASLYLKECMKGQMNFSSKDGSVNCSKSEGKIRGIIFKIKKDKNVN